METERKAPITGREGGPIELEKAAKWTKHYRETHPGETISQFFGKEILEKILAQEGCLGIRFYYAQDEPGHGRKHLVIAGVMSDGSDQLGEKHGHAPAEAKAVAHTLYHATVGDQSIPCPGSPGCPKNVLTGGDD